MKKYQFRGTINGSPAFLARIDKRRARSLFEMGGTVYLVPVNFVPFGAWIQPVPVNKDQGETFEAYVNSFTYYNCINSETGYFPAYYVNLIKTPHL
jgi:hypothetical protein